MLTFSKLLPAAPLYGILLLAACKEDKPAAVAVKPGPAAAERHVPAVRPATRAAGKSMCLITNDSLAGQPFGPEPTVADLLEAGATVVSRKPFANLYEQGQVDTILVLRHQGNRFEFYRAPEKDLLRQATITNFQPAYGQQLQANIRSASQKNASGCQNLRIGDTERANYVSVTYNGTRISTVKVEPYVD